MILMCQKFANAANNVAIWQLTTDCILYGAAVCHQAGQAQIPATIFTHRAHQQKANRVWRAHLLLRSFCVCIWSAAHKQTDSAQKAFAHYLANIIWPWCPPLCVRFHSTWLTCNRGDIMGYNAGASAEIGSSRPLAPHRASERGSRRRSSSIL